MLAGMSKNIEEFRDIIDRWPATDKPLNRASKPQERRYTGSIQAFADDMGMPYPRAQLMRHRNSINPKYWNKLIEVAKARGVRGVTIKRLSELYESRWESAA